MQNKGSETEYKKIFETAWDSAGAVSFQSLIFWTNNLFELGLVVHSVKVSFSEAAVMFSAERLVQAPVV